MKEEIEQLFTKLYAICEELSKQNSWYARLAIQYLDDAKCMIDSITFCEYYEGRTMKFSEFVKELEYPEKLIEAVGDSDFDTFWASCQEPVYMMILARGMGFCDQQTFCAINAAIASDVRQWFTHEWHGNLLDAALAYGNGTGPIDDVKKWASKIADGEKGDPPFSVANLAIDRPLTNVVASAWARRAIFEHGGKAPNYADLIRQKIKIDKSNFLYNINQ